MLHNHHKIRSRHIKSHNLCCPTQWELPELLGYKQGARRACTPLAPVVPLSHRTLENASFGVLWGPGQSLQSLRPSLAENNNINDTKKKIRKVSETL